MSYIITKLECLMIEYIDIDFSDVRTDIGFVPMSDNYSSMCRRLITKILYTYNKYSIENSINFDRIYVPHTILNILSDASGFSTYGLGDLSEDQPIGNLSGMLDVYISFNLPRNQMVFSFDKTLVRDNKIDSLLDGSVDYSLQEVTLEIKSQFLL